MEPSAGIPDFLTRNQNAFIIVFQTVWCFFGVLPNLSGLMFFSMGLFEVVKTEKYIKKWLFQRKLKKDPEFNTFIMTLSL